MIQSFHLGYLSEKRNTNSKRYTHPIFTAAPLTTAKMRQQLKCPLTDEWVKKVRDIHTVEYYLAIRTRKSCHSFMEGGRRSKAQTSC